MPGSPSSDARAERRTAESASVPLVDPTSDDARRRRRLRWHAVLPPAVSALLCVVTAGYLMADGGSRSDAFLLGGFLVVVLLLAAAGVQAIGLVRQVDDGVGTLRTALAEAYAEADRLTELLRRAEERPKPVRTSAGRQVEVFMNLSRRLQSLVHREIKLLDALENEVEDPDLLKGLFQVDHLATRIRRHAENLAVLGGAVSRRQWSRPVALTEVLRSAIAEVEYYSRVKLVPPIEGTVPGHAVASIIHLVAELIENATMFAPPQTQVLLRAQHVTAGVVVEVEDRGLGMPRADQDRINRLLANPEDIDLDDLLSDGRIGLFVVSMIARPHGITVRLQTNIYGGTQAVVVLPQALLDSGSADRADDRGNGQPSLPPPATSPPAMSPSAMSQQTMLQPALSQQAMSQQAMSQQAMSQYTMSQHTMELPRRSIVSQEVTAAPAPWSAFAPPSVAADDDWPLPVAGAMPAVAAGPRPALPASAGPRPPLPRRHSQTHLVPQLQLGPPSAVRDPAGEHDPGLMASFMGGVSRGEAGGESEPAGNHRADGPA